MPWLDTHGDNNKIIDEERDEVETRTVGLMEAGGAVSQWKRTVAITQTRYVGMTETAARTCMVALNDPPDVTAIMQKENIGGAYQVLVTERTDGEWEQVA